MTASREALEDKLQEYQGQVKGLSAYITELTSMAAKHGTEQSQIEADLLEAQHNISYYEGEIERLNVQMQEEAVGLAFSVYQDAAGDWRWQLRAKNHRIIADSGEGYESKRACLHGIALVKESYTAVLKLGK